METPKQTIERLSDEVRILISHAPLSGKRDPRDIQEAIKPFINKYIELQNVALKLIEENDNLKAQTPLGLSIARGHRLP